jgi:hypothetical protein
MSVIDEAGDYYRTTVSSQLSHQDTLKVIFYMYYVTGCPYQILTSGTRRVILITNPVVNCE